MGIKQVTTNSRYAKLHDDVTFYVQYESPLTAEEINTTWDILYTPDLIFRDQYVTCNVQRENKEDTVVLSVKGFKELLSSYTEIELRNVGCFTLRRKYLNTSEDIIMVVQTYSEDEINVILERAIEQ